MRVIVNAANFNVAAVTIDRKDMPHLLRVTFGTNLPPRPCLLRALRQRVTDREWQAIVSQLPQSSVTA